MVAVEWIAIALGAYVGVVIAFEILVVILGARQAARGVRPDEDWIVITTSDANGSSETVLGGVESNGQLYVSANHWPRAWYRRALENPEVRVTIEGGEADYRAVPVDGAERARVAAEHPIAFKHRFRMGFAPRAFLRLEPRET